MSSASQYIEVLAFFDSIEFSVLKRATELLAQNMWSTNALEAKTSLKVLSLDTIFYLNDLHTNCIN